MRFNAFLHIVVHSYFLFGFNLSCFYTVSWLLLPFNLLLIGGVPEWSKGTDCKSVGVAFGGSNPPPTTFYQVETIDTDGLFC